MTKQQAFTREDLLRCSRGELFGPGNAQLPAPNMLMVDRIVHISEVGGKYGKGELVAELERSLSATARGSKNTELLQIASALTRAVGGGRATCCKSAKDRTAMSVTLEHAFLLARHHGVSEDVVDVADTMRAFGVRKDNVKLNTGKTGYAFNALQKRMLPAAYQPPRK